MPAPAGVIARSTWPLSVKEADPQRRVLSWSDAQRELDGVVRIKQVASQGEAGQFFFYAGTYLLRETPDPSGTRTSRPLSTTSRRQPICAMRPIRNRPTVTTCAPGCGEVSNSKLTLPLAGSTGWSAESKTTVPLMAMSAREGMRMTSRQRCDPGVSGVTTVERNAAARWLAI